MDVHLAPALRAFVDEMLASGQFGSESEVVGAALRLMIRSERSLAAFLRWAEPRLEGGAGRVLEAAREDALADMMQEMLEEA